MSTLCQEACREQPESDAASDAAVSNAEMSAIEATENPDLKAVRINREQTGSDGPVISGRVSVWLPDGNSNIF